MAKKTRGRGAKKFRGQAFIEGLAGKIGIVMATITRRRSAKFYRNTPARVAH